MTLQLPLPLPKRQRKAACFKRYKRAELLSRWVPEQLCEKEVSTNPQWTDRVSEK